MTEVERITNMIAPDPNSGCWLWMGSDTGKGYGQFRKTSGKQIMAHRAVYELLVGEIPKGLQLDHLCRVRCCVNPAHLEPVTCKENIRRGDTGSNNSSKTHCQKGHPYSGDNLYIKPNGARDCKTCRSLAVKKFKEKKRDRG